MKVILLAAFIAICACSIAQPNKNSIPTDTAAINIKSLAEQVVSNAPGNYAKAKTLLLWLSRNFDWKATDYKERTVKQIMARKGGNCFEMATVYMAMLKELKLTYRPIAEVNINRFDEERGKSAEQKIKESGNRMSVFGKQHNDHRWVEIFDDKTNQWIPADPTMGLIGYDQWLKGRAWFGPRHTINDSFNKDMIVPFAIFVISPTDKYQMEENRTSHYLVDELNALYHDQLSKLPSWNAWVTGVQQLSTAAKKAFAGTENLHEHTDQIAALATTYQKLKKEYYAHHQKQ